jgi:hypothetical protein
MVAARRERLAGRTTTHQRRSLWAWCLSLCFGRSALRVKRRRICRGLAACDWAPALVVCFRFHATGQPSPAGGAGVGSEARTDRIRVLDGAKLVIALTSRSAPSVVAGSSKGLGHRRRTGCVARASEIFAADLWRLFLISCGNSIVYAGDAARGLRCHAVIWNVTLCEAPPLGVTVIR